MNMKIKKTVLAAALLAFMSTISVAYAYADDDGDEGYRQYSEGRGGNYGGEHGGGSLMPAQLNAKFKQECTSCHIAYSPGLLPAESWRKIMAGLDKHFGSDASLDIKDNKEITDFLVSNASSRWNGPGTPLRITETAWFKREHDGEEISPSVWKSPQVKSPSNCGACHTQAEQGDFGEGNIKVPRVSFNGKGGGIL